MTGINTRRAMPRALVSTLIWLGLSLPLSAQETLSVAWSHWPPFSQREADGHLDGVDIRLTRQILQEAGLSPEFRDIPWARALHLIERQQLDMAMGAMDTPERRQFAHFSVPYRHASFVLLSHQGTQEAPDRWQGIARFADLCQQTRLRLGKLRGTRPTPLTEACPSLRLAREYNSDDKLIELLLARRLDGVIMEWQHAQHRLTQLGAQEQIQCQLLLHRQPVSLIIAKGALSKAALARIDMAINTQRHLVPTLSAPRCRFDNTRFPDSDA